MTMFKMNEPIDMGDDPVLMDEWEVEAARCRLYVTNRMQAAVEHLVSRQVLRGTLIMNGVVTRIGLTKQGRILVFPEQ